MGYRNKNGIFLCSEFLIEQRYFPLFLEERRTKQLEFGIEKLVERLPGKKKNTHYPDLQYIVKSQLYRPSAEEMD